MPTLSVNWLGPPRIAIDGRAVRLETRKATALLAVLSLDRTAQPREHLAALFWPEYDQQRAPANLRRALASLQSGLGPGWLSADRETVALVGEVIVDFNDLTRMVRAVREHHPRAEDRLCPACEAHLQAAAGLHRGDFLQGFNLKDSPSFDLWQTQKRGELLQAMTWALERLTEASSEAGRWEEAIERAQRWLALDGLHEPAHRALMFCFARSGKRSTALRQFEACARVLRDELGQEPDERTRMLHERIRNRKLEALTAPAPDPRPGLSPVAQPPSPPASMAPAAANTARRDALPTRLRPPPARPALVTRERLFALLDLGIHLPLTLISAPAGFGKTTLLAEWARRCGLPVAWLSMEEADSDPVHLFTGFASALGNLDARLGIEALQMLRSIQTPSLPAVAESLLADLSRFPDRRVFVLDDYHLADRPGIATLLADLILRMPPDLRLVIATRHDPALPLGRLRARAQLAEIRADALRFQPEETTAFLHQVMGLPMSEEDVSVLGQRTEGWAAGLQMAALSLQGRQDLSEAIRGFSGSHRFVMDYLIEEVLTIQPTHLQEFLLSTSVLETFCAGLCDELTGTSGSQALLEGLDRANLFLVSLDQERSWYRYHHLFAELLRNRLRQGRPQHAIDDLHRRAGRWLEANGDHAGAMHHFLAGRCHPEALRLMDRQHQLVLAQGGLGALLGWIARLPDEAIRHDLAACITVGTVHGWAGQQDEAERRFAQAESLLAGGEAHEPATRIAELTGRMTAMRAFIADMAGDTARAVELAHRADGNLPVDQAMLRTMVPYILGKAYRYQGDLERAEPYTHEQIRVAREANTIWGLSGALHELVWLYRLQGRLRLADRALDDFDSRPREPGNAGPIAKLVADRGELQRERGALDAAALTIRTALEDVRRWGQPSDRYFCHLTRCRLELSAGLPDRAAEDVAQADELARTSLVYASMLPLLEAERVRMLLARGQLTEALAWLESYRFPSGGSPLNHEVIQIARARILNAAGRYADADDLLDRLAAGAGAGGRAGRLVEILVLRAVSRAADASGIKPALVHLERALALAEPEGYARVFLDEGEPALRLLRMCAEPTPAFPPPLAAYARGLLERAPR